MMKHLHYLLLFVIGTMVFACQEYTPKPSGYFRINIPEHKYVTNNQFEDFEFRVAEETFIRKLPKDKGKEYFNIVYPLFNAEIFCSFIPTKKENIPEHSEESRKFVYLHALKAEAIREKVYENVEQNVYGLIYNIRGNVASPTQFVLTDSIKFFFRGALYFNNIPNQDSIAPVLEYINKDIQVLIESFQWKQKKK